MKAKLNAWANDHKVLVETLLSYAIIVGLIFAAFLLLLSFPTWVLGGSFWALIKSCAVAAWVLGLCIGTAFCANEVWK